MSEALGIRIREIVEPLIMPYLHMNKTADNRMHKFIDVNLDAQVEMALYDMHANKELVSYDIWSKHFSPNFIQLDVRVRETWDDKHFIVCVSGMLEDQESAFDNAMAGV